ncbi:type IX secretion system membrane protein, PorP/SprF family [Reichenbachiella agariperforans]|uniref:Type IX secretion system membrane protein, PorP/SprF family n=1 Tax=Reichenbachiella agariperforans TaxID=156994 RepID=A0A1M6WWW2_REIAG|nr:PorP/SprF family type IX secretion system membrane protein [Reichenbachiella agariperforans]SHK98198.1 type IX secretion system membrane protein, PorP/SprF family [Reichenbachiella agariperforans]
MRKHFILISVLVVIVGPLWAQQSVYTINQFTPLLINPAYATMNYDADLSFFREELTIGQGEFFNTNSLNADYVFVEKESGRRLLGLGFNGLSKDTGTSDLLKTYRAGLSVAVPIELTEGQFLHFGLNATYVNIRTSMDQLSTGSQWIASEFRYDPSSGLGESFEVQQLSYVSLSGGLIWDIQKENRPFATFGVSVWELNKPEASFFDEEVRTPMTFCFHGESVLYERAKFKLTPSFYYQREGSVNTYTAMVSSKLFFRNDNPYDIIQSGNLDVIARYGFNQDASLAVVFNQPHFSFGFSYNFPLGTQNQYLQNGIQLGVTVSKTLWRPRTKTITIETVSSRRQFDFEQTAVVREQKSEVEQMKSELEQLDKVKTLQFELSKDFHFARAEAQLTADSYPFLDDMVKLMKENPAWTLQVIGHTDNVGSKKDNYELSLLRARAVEEYLLSHGMAGEQVTILGRGDTEPIASNDTEEGKAENRRVQFLIHAINE